MKNLLKYLAFLSLNLSKTNKLILIIGVDSFAIILSFYISYFLRTNEFPIINDYYLILTVFSNLLLITIFIILGFYKQVLRHSNLNIIISSGFAAILYALIFTSILNFLNIFNFPRTIGIIQSTIIFSYILFIRIIIKKILNTNFAYKNYKNIKNVMIYGTGTVEMSIADIIGNQNNFKLVGFFEDDRQLIGRDINSHRIFSVDHLRYCIDKKNVHSIICSFENLNIDKRNLINLSIDYGLSIYSIPQFLNKIIKNENYSSLNQIDMLTLIGRKQIEPNEKLLQLNTTNKIIMITGAGGSIGSELARQIFKLLPKTIILVDNNEFALYNIENELSELQNNNNKIQITPKLGSVTDYNRINHIIQAFSPDIIYHAAAYKHVPLVEDNISEAVKTNILGTKNILDIALKFQIDNLVLVSTDKAVRPTNVMGTTKRIAELLFHRINENKLKTKLSIVRFGNVVGSSGSVIPKFIEQIKRGGPITVTSKEVTRFFMTIPEASQLIIQAASLSKKIDTFVLDMGESINIFDLAKRMIRISGLSVKDQTNVSGDIEINVVGLRPGEKLFEELIYSGELLNTAHPGIYAINEKSEVQTNFEKDLSNLMDLLDTNDANEIKSKLKKIVPQFTPL